MRREREDRVKPRNAYPFPKEVTFVFSRLSCKPRPPSSTCSTRASASLTEAQRRRMEQGFKDRSQKAANHLLRDPIANCSNTEGPNLGLILRNEYTSERVWLKGTRFEIPHQRPEIIGKIGFKHLDAD